MSQRWTFTDTGTTEVWRLPRNPRVMDNLHARRSTATERSPFGHVHVLRTAVGAFPWEFQGRVHAQDEYDAFLDWADRAQIVVTDHLGREHLVVPVAFEPTPYPQNGTRNPWLFDYTFKTIYLGRQA